MFKPITRLYQMGQTRELDKIAIEKFKIPSISLMERAGQAAFSALQQRWPNAEKILVVCGKGNNAGDGYVVARLAKENGLLVKVLFLTEPEKLTGDALIAAQNCAENGVEVMPFSLEKLAQADVIVDAILGSGIKGEVRGEVRAAIEMLNLANTPIISIDLPSGLNADSGNPSSVAIKADLTVTFIGAKQGLFTGMAADYCGEIIFSDLGVPSEVYENVTANAALVDISNLSHYLPKRKRTDHKGKFGHVLVIGGNYGMAGAVRMAAEAAARVGAGITTVATQPEHVLVVSGMRPELMCHGITSALELESLLSRATVVVIGPGLGKSSWSKELFAAVLASDAPKVVDADGLNLLAKKPFYSDNWVLTPHPGEAARLLNCSVADIQADRFSAVRAIQNRYGGVCVLKGAGTLIAGVDPVVAVANFANPGMASGGMGDVLSGIIGGLLAQHVSLVYAAQFGVALHGKAAELAVSESGERGLLATDLISYARRLLNEI